MAKQDWSSFIKKYVWDDDKTPYFVAVAKLTKKQANAEVFVYVCFLAVLFTVLGLSFCTPNAPYGQSYAAAFYCFTIAASAVMLHLYKEVPAAMYCALAPAAVLMFFLFNGFRPTTPGIDKFMILGASALVLWYSVRIVAISRHYDYMQEDRDRAGE